MARKSAWTWPWSRRKSIFDAPTPLDKLLESPLRTVIVIIYRLLLWLRGAPFTPPPNKRPIRVVCISDTHCNQPAVPDGDLLIHAGDMTNAGTISEIQAQFDWLNSLPHRHKVVVVGNHDSYFDETSRKEEDREPSRQLNFHVLHYLQNRAVTLEFDDGRQLNIYGAADIPKCGGSDFAFQYERQAAPWGNRIPRETDILVTHTPPRGHLDLDLGCAALLREIWQVRARLHVFGHVHSARGREAVFWDQGQAAYERLLARKGGVVRDVLPSAAWWDALQVVVYGACGVLWQWLMVGAHGAHGGLLINAAMVWRTTTELGNPAEVVDL